MIDYRCGDVLVQLARMKAEGVKVRTCVTSPPYWGLRDYGTAGQIGLERTPDEYVAKMVEVFGAVREVLSDDGTLWVNLGDSFATNGYSAHGQDRKFDGGAGTWPNRQTGAMKTTGNGIKPKDLVGIPWRVAFALQADGWYLRSDIIWHKPNPMPESVTDRPTKSHEYIFLLSKSPKYFYDADAVRETTSDDSGWAKQRAKGDTRYSKKYGKRWDPAFSSDHVIANNPNGRNRRSVWTVTTKPYRGAHFATFPPDLIEPCILAGTSAKGQCSKCGAAWVRVTERKDKRHLTERNEYTETSRYALDNNGSGRRDGRADFKPAEFETIGWQPSCDCDAGEPIPDIVLDPFGGSGTTAEVAIKHGRRAILIELNPAYVELQKERLSKVQIQLGLLG